MNSDKDKSKDSAFSFEKTPAKIGGKSETGKSGQDNDFNFSDIPVLGGKSDKDKKVSFSFDAKRNIKQEPKEPGLSSYEAILRDQLNKPKEKAKFYDVPETESQQPGTDESQSRWDKIAAAKTSDPKLIKSVRILIVSTIAIAIVVAAGLLSFFLLKPKLQTTQVPQTSRTVKPDPKAEENARRLADLEKKLTDADSARKESKFKDALNAYQAILSEEWKEKEPLILFSAAECLENMSQDDEAVSYYRKCIDAGWKENAKPYVRISKLLNRKKKYADSIKYLEKAREAFPTDTSIGAQLADSYYHAGQIDKAAAELKKSNKTDLSLDMIKLYGSVLQKNNEKDQARELYIYGMKKFRDLDCFIGAANLSDKPQDKIEIMTQAVDTVDENSKNKAVMSLAELLMQNSRKDEAAKQFDKLTLGQLKPEDATDFLKALINCANLPKFSSEYKKAIELYPETLPMHRTVFETLIENGLETLALGTYKEWWSQKKDAPVAGYFYAK
jgi:predicted negative regulator of RcsB-dependent stress response